MTTFAGVSIFIQPLLSIICRFICARCVEIWKPKILEKPFLCFLVSFSRTRIDIVLTTTTTTTPVVVVLPPLFTIIYSPFLGNLFECYMHGRRGRTGDCTHSHVKCENSAKWNCFSWNRKINKIREEEGKTHGVSCGRKWILSIFCDLVAVTPQTLSLHRIRSALRRRILYIFFNCLLLISDNNSMSVGPPQWKRQYMENDWWN